jgi:hypothetical protein
MPYHLKIEPPADPIVQVSYPYDSLVFTIADIVFFSYEDNTMLQLFDSSNTLIWNNSGNPLNKGEHATVTVPGGVYTTKGSKMFAVLSGDPISNCVVGYYAMDNRGYGVSQELYTYVPPIYGHCKFIVFGYEDNTSVSVDYTETGANIATFTLNRGDHWDDETLQQDWIHVTSDKPVSALTCYDQGYFVPAASGKWSGTEFYTYVSDIAGWPQDLTVIGYNEGTNVTIKNSDTDAVIWSGVLNDGENHVESFPNGANIFFDILSDKDVTVSVQPWVSTTSSYAQGAYVADRNGGGIGKDFLGSTLDGGYLYILSYNDGTHVVISGPEKNGTYEADYNLNKREFVNANPGNGLWRIRSDKPVSAYSGWGEFNADFVPVEFAVPVQDAKIEKTCTSHQSGPIDVGETVTFEIKITNLGTYPIDILPLTDTYNVYSLSFQNATPLPDDASDDGQLDWSDITAFLGDLAPEESISVTVEFMAIGPTPSTDNVIEMEGAKDSQQYEVPKKEDTASVEIVVIVYAPTNLSGMQVFNRSLLMGEYNNRVSWAANPVNQNPYKNITHYRIYKIESDGIKTLLKEVDSNTFEYWQIGVTKGESYTYGVSAVHNGTLEGEAAQVTIQGSSLKLRIKRKSTYNLRNVSKVDKIKRGPDVYL